MLPFRYLFIDTSYLNAKYLPKKLYAIIIYGIGRANLVIVLNSHRWL